MTTHNVSRMIARTRAVLFSFVVAVLVLGVSGTLHGEDVVTHWNQVMMDVSAADGIQAIRGTREFAIVQAAVFDSINGIKQKYSPIHADFAGQADASVHAAAIESAYRTLLGLHPAQEKTLRAERRSSLAKLQASRQAIKLGQDYGAMVAEDILAWRSTDGLEVVLPPFLGGENIGQWRPTPPDFSPAAFPQFATMATWSLQSPDQFRPGGPPSLTSDQYAADFNEVKTWGSAVDSPRTADQTLLAIFWHGNTPAFWNRIARTVMNNHPRMSLIRKARVFAMLNITMADALIACWDAKFHYEFWRPITAIMLADRDGNPATEVDASWTPMLENTPAHYLTPAHPDYPSGHSTVSASAASVLAHFFGDNTEFLIDSEVTEGVWRFFPSFSAAISEINDARVFGGIHFRTACVHGNGVGAQVARYVLRHAMQPI